MNRRPTAARTAMEKVDQFIRMAAETPLPPGASRDDFIREVSWKIGFSYDELLAIKAALTAPGRM